MPKTYTGICGYCKQEFRSAEYRQKFCNKSCSSRANARKTLPDNALSKGRQEELKKLLSEAVSYSEISRKTGLRSSTISHHAKRLGFAKRVRPSYDWAAVGEALLAGESLSSVRLRFGFSKAAFDNARARGSINFRFTQSLSSKEYAAAMQGVNARPHHRNALRKRIIREGRKPECAGCGISAWQGKRIILELDHVDGDSSNNQPDNLRLLCPNCHSQTDTWRGRNVKRKREARLLLVA